MDAEEREELSHGYGGCGERDSGLAAIGAILTLFPEPLAIGGREIRLASQLFAAQPRLSARDALHTAVAMLHGADAIISVDRDFDAVHGRRRLEPADPTPWA